jgi:hypothetical protein
MHQFVVMDLGPRFDKTLLRTRQRAADALDRIERENRFTFLVDGMEVRSMMRCADLWNMRMMIPKKRESSGTAVLYIIVITTVPR